MPAKPPGHSYTVSRAALILVQWYRVATLYLKYNIHPRETVRERIGISYIKHSYINMPAKYSNHTHNNSSAA